jgi:DnaJ like chaperone protein
MLLVDGLTVKKLQVFNQILTQLGFAAYHEQPQAEFSWNPFESHGFGQQQSHSSHHQRSTFSHASDLENPYTILGVPPSASKQEVKRAYRRLVSQHHPDKLIAAKASAERIKQANIKTQQIRKAYEQIMNG